MELPGFSQHQIYISKKVLTPLFQNTHGCQFLMMLTKYFRLTNYTWMFCEGYYLHRLLANTFEEERSITFILSIGWGKYYLNTWFWLVLV